MPMYIFLSNELVLNMALKKLKKCEIKEAYARLLIYKDVTAMTDRVRKKVWYRSTMKLIFRPSVK